MKYPIALAAIAILATPMASRADPDEIRNAFWNSYYASQTGFNSVPDNTGTEAVINEMRAARGAPPCAIGLLRQMIMSRPAC